MAFLPITIPTLILLLFISLPTATLSQDPNSSGPSIAQCAPSLLPLAPCAPFVQGAAQSPSQPCCSNLKQLYTQEPHCLCLLVNDTSFNSFPINNTLALQLPLLCSLQVNISPCSGINLPSNTSLGTNTNSTVGTNTNKTIAASPTVPVQPRTNIMGSGIDRSTSTILRGEGDFALATAMAAFLLTTLLY